MQKNELLTNMVELHDYLYHKVLNWDYDTRLNEMDKVYQEVFSSWEYKKKIHERVLDINENLKIKSK